MAGVINRVRSVESASCSADGNQTYVFGDIKKIIVRHHFVPNIDLFSRLANVIQVCLPWTLLRHGLMCHEDEKQYA